MLEGLYTGQLAVISWVSVAVFFSFLERWGKGKENGGK